MACRESVVEEDAPVHMVALEDLDHQEDPANLVTRDLSERLEQSVQMVPLETVVSVEREASVELQVQLVSQVGEDSWAPQFYRKAT